MAGALASTFVTGADGLLGLELIRVLAGRGHQVTGLAPTVQAAEQIRRAGALPVLGDLLQPDRWQDEAAADWVFHLPPQPRRGARLNRRQAAAMASARLLMDGHLLDTVAAGATRRIVYVTDTRCYGPTGPRPVTEDEPRHPSPWGNLLLPAIDRLDGYLIAGLPLITALPGWVYGNGAWLREQIVEPVLTGGRVRQFGSTGPWVSPIHVHDCARALVHVADHGTVGGQYFLVGDAPVRLHDFARLFARLAGRPLRVWHLPVAAARLVIGPVVADDLTADAAFSNIRLRGIGFRFLYPTIEQGLQRVLGEFHEY
jgi:uncharacterized protein